MIHLENKIYSLYIHIPFCKHICFYCDFPKLFLINNIVDKYLKTLIFELQKLKINHKLKTIYIGGGTPTSVKLTLLLKALKKYVDKNTEFTIEGDINDFNKKKILEFKKNGVNRISIGVQSTDNKILRHLGRAHTKEQIFKKMQLIKQYFSNINIDLIYGFNELSIKKLRHILKEYLSLGVQHISTYSLEIKKGTIFFNQNKKEADDKLVCRQFDIIFDTLTKNNFFRYEISNFSKKGFESKHNLNYWKNKEFYGIGLGAASYVNGFRYKNTLSMTEYLKKNFICEREKISLAENKKYYVMLNLRTSQGINLDEYKKVFSEDFFEKNKEKIKYFIKKKFLRKNKKNIIATYDGSMVLDRIIMDFF
ncbi:MAG: radical SAM family heme chaperone HemW [Bacilli bacterium]|nr:radical SAM family heme chaperone HemW [Bacilli bacterium]